MVKLKSKLENNIFDNVLVKKGINHISEELFNKLKQNKAFKSFCDLGYIACTVKEKVKEVKEELTNKPDFSAMSYDELKAYVKEHNIKVPSLKKVDILAVLNK